MKLRCYCCGESLEKRDDIALVQTAGTDDEVEGSVISVQRVEKRGAKRRY